MALAAGNEPTTTAAVTVLLSRDRQLSARLGQHLADHEPAIELHVVSRIEVLRDHATHVQPEILVVDLASLDAHETSAVLSSPTLPCSAVIVVGTPPAGIDRLREQCRAPLSQVADATAIVPEISRLLAATQRALGTDRRFLETVQHYRDILEASSDGIFVLLGGVFTFVNQSFAAAVGLEKSELLGQRTLLDLAQEDDRVMLAEELARLAVVGGKRDVFELGLSRADGVIRRFEIACRSSVVDGRRTVVGVARDVTAVRTLQDEIERARQRGAQIERLRALGELAAGVAHDFNNALEAILGRVERARDRLARGESPLEDLEVVERAARGAAETVRRISGFARPADADAWHEIDLQAVVRDVAAMAQTQVPERIRFRVDAHPTPRLLGNAAELREGLLNLVTNAVDAIEGQGEIALRCFNEDGLAVVEVCDTGCGMPEEVRDRLFEPFFTTKGQAGTGLGLSVTHGILRRHDAEIQLATEPGSGTTFRLLFSPVAAAPTQAKAFTGDALHILVVDDDQAVAELLRDLLLELGHQVTLANSAAEALTALAQYGADLLLTDLDLAETSGWQLARQARRQRPDLLIGMVTGWPLGASDAEIKRRGVDFVIAKPFSLSTLIETLASLRR